MQRALPVVFVLLAACTSASPAPKGWERVPGAGQTWSRGSGANAQQYSYVKRTFAGALPDLASQVAIDTLLQNHGARLQASKPFEPCPGAAGLATFTLPASETLQVGFSVRDGQAIRVSYARPAGTPVDPNVTQAMQNAICTL